MTVEEAIVDRLLANSAVAAIVGTRGYQLKLPQRVTLPAVLVQAISVVDFYHLRGGDLIERSRVQTDAYTSEASGHDPYAEVSTLAAAIHAALNGQRFPAGDSPMTLEITGVFRVNRMALYESEELRQVRIVQDYLVWSRRMAA